MKYREAIGLIKLAANGWDYRQAAEQAKSGVTPSWTNTNVWAPQQQLQKQQQIAAAHPQQTQQMAQQRAQGTFDAIKGGTVEFFKELPNSVANAGRGLIRGAVNMVPGAVATAMNIPYTMQRAGEIMTGKYQNYNGFWNKWKASKEQGEDSWAKFSANAANDFMDRLNGLEDKAGIAYDENYPQYARTLAEGTGAFMAGMGLSAASQASPVLGKKPTIQLAKPAPGSVAQTASTAAKPTPQSTGVWKAMDQAYDTYNSIPKSPSALTQRVAHAGVDKFMPTSWQDAAHKTVDATAATYNSLVKPMSQAWSMPTIQPAAPTAQMTQTNNEVSTPAPVPVSAAAPSPYEQYAANWNNTYGGEY